MMWNSSAGSSTVIGSGSSDGLLTSNGSDFRRSLSGNLEEMVEERPHLDTLVAACKECMSACSLLQRVRLDHGLHGVDLPRHEEPGHAGRMLADAVPWRTPRAGCHFGRPAHATTTPAATSVATATGTFPSSTTGLRSARYLRAD